VTSNEALIERFYAAFARRDGAEMEACYRPDVHFSDPVFVDHIDDFDFHRWARQALGTSGLLLGWTPLLRNAVRRRARAGLDAFLAR
jgi:hypothetical protein